MKPFVRLATLALLPLAGLVLTPTLASATASYNSPSKITATGDAILNWTGQGTTSALDCSAANDPYGLNMPYLMWIFTTDSGTVTGDPVLTVDSTTYTKYTQPATSTYQFFTAYYSTTDPPTTASMAFTVATTGTGDWVLTISHGCAGPPPPTTTSITTQSSQTGTVAPTTSVTDTATVTPSTAVGSVMFTITLNGGTPATVDAAVALSGGTATSSAYTNDTAAGTYCWQAYFTPTDAANFTASQDTSTTNECFTVAAGPVQATITTVVFDAATTAPLIGGNLAAGGTAFDTSTVSPDGATGTTSYLFFTNGSCTGGTSAGEGLSLDTKSSNEGPLSAGSYSFEAVFTSDNTALFTNATGTCEPFSVTAAPTGPTSTTTSTAVFDVATNAALIDGNLTASGSAYDTSTVTTGATGTVSYLFWTNGDCGVSEDVAGTGAGTALALGSHSSVEGPLTAGSYSFEAVFTSDNTALFTGSTGACEPFTVVAGGSTASPSPTATPTGGVLAATALAATGDNTPAQSLALLLIAFGLLAMVGGALAWRRRRI